MNPVIVVDASAAIKWVVREEFSEQALTLYDDAASSAIVGPPALLTEVTNAIYQRTRRRDPATRLTAEEAQAALDRFLTLGVRIEASDALYREAFGFARQQALPNIYDTLYVVLARLLGTELWTDDRKLLDAVRNVAPWVRWIRDYPLPAQ
ncbi:MAG TPA: type II toxin-antitoxin system VapC family toxin [Chloroflexota bacterium]|jgi:predicted nucleic acid-binding protein